MEITVTITLPEDEVHKAVLNSFLHLLSRPQYSQGGLAYQQIQRQVFDYITGLDLRPMIQEYADKTLRSVVSEVVAGEIARQVKADVKSAMEKGELLKVLGA